MRNRKFLCCGLIVHLNHKIFSLELTSTEGWRIKYISQGGGGVVYICIKVGIEKILMERISFFFTMLCFI